VRREEETGARVPRWFCLTLGVFGLAGDVFRPLDGGHLDGSDMLSWGDPWVVWLCLLIGWKQVFMIYSFV
jgi:hypothetical protein